MGYLAQLSPVFSGPTGYYSAWPIRVERRDGDSNEDDDNDDDYDDDQATVRH